MEEVYPKLYVGGDMDYEKLEGQKGWSFLRCAKEGAGGHRQTLGYSTLGAPKDSKDYLVTRKVNRMALNLIDAFDPNYIAPNMLLEGLDFIDERLAAGDKVLVACNQGHSRGPTVALLWMRRAGDMPHNFGISERIFHTLYPHYEPKAGIRQVARSLWSKLNDIERDTK